MRFRCNIRCRTASPGLRLAAVIATLCVAGASPVHASNEPVASDASQLLERYGNGAQELVNQGMEYLGIRYRFGGSSPETGLDCSGLVQNVFRNALGLDLPRTAREMARLGDKVGLDDLKPGDLVFFNTMRRAFSHVGIYVGEGRFLHAPARGGKVRIDDMDRRYWTTRFNGARRLVPEAASSLPVMP